MINENILERSLNDQIGYDQFFKALGYKDNDKIFMRSFKDKGEKDGGINSDIQLSRLDAMIAMQKKRNAEDRGIFFVVNGGGQSDREVKTARAQFVDFDDFPFEEQIRRLNDFPLEPSIIIKTKKSLHCYWLLDHGELKFFREVQQRLNQYFGSDPVIQNESRVMRLYGFEHRKTDVPVMVTLIKFDPELKYTQRQFHENLPLLTAQTKSSQATITKSAERVPVGQGHYYVVKRIGEFLDRLGDSADDQAILALVETDFMSKYEDTSRVDLDDFRKKYLKTITKLRARHEAEQSDPTFYSYALKAWKEENPGKDFDRDVVSWDEVREAGRRAKEADKRFDEGFSAWQKTKQTATQDFDQVSQNPPETSVRNLTKVINVGDYLKDNVFDSDIAYFKKYKDRKIGFENVDKYLTLYPGVACLGGASSLGKTTFAVNLVDNLLRKGESVIYFALEQLPIELITKSLARRVYEIDPASPIDNINIKNGASSDALIRARSEYSQTARNYQIVEGDFHFTVQTIVDHVEEYIKVTGVKPIVVIDYLQLIAPPDGFKGTQREITDENLKAIKDLSKRNELFILLISSFNRASYKEPVGMESFKESGMIEYTCDYILGLQLSILEDSDFYTSTGSRGGERENNNDKKEKKLYEAINQSPKEVELVALKNRNGRQRFKCFFKYEMKFDTFSPDMNSRFDPDSASSDFKPISPGMSVPFKTV